MTAHAQFPGSRRSLTLLLWLTAALSLANWCAAADLTHPAKATLRESSRQCRQILKTSVIDFYLPACLDRTHGGYLEWMEADRFVAQGEKFLTLQARQIWFFSTLASRGVEKESALAAARTGFEFLQAKFRDPTHGGYYAKVSDAGEPRDKRKHVYLNAFALYALSAYYRATNAPEALEAAQALFQTLEKKAHDAGRGGYLEFFEEDWQPILDRNVQSFIGPGGTKTFNTHLHVMEAFAELYRVWPDPLVRQRLDELILVNTQTVRLPAFGCNVDAFTLEWEPLQTPQNLRASYGHDIECAWLVLDASRTLGHSPKLLRGWAEGLVGYSLRHGFDRQQGGFFYTGALGKPADDTTKTWWVQAEGLVALLEMYRLTGEPLYFDKFQKTLQFVAQHQVAPGGSWWASCDAAGKPLNSIKTSMWQGAYHNGRAMLLCIDLLEELAEGRRPTP
ncbi:MAG: AGE family epimerase/isomerase [Planctomycetes bacterium]|nr:AGE family epimerase/isomerase [Planctomycetota bacterium]